jgi:hypothetical protein
LISKLMEEKNSLMEQNKKLREELVSVFFWLILLPVA